MSEFDEHLRADPLIRWTNYDARRDCEQGHITGKEELTKQFLAESCLVPGYDYSGLEGKQQN